jgi:tight adherence protein B
MFLNSMIFVGVLLLTFAVIFLVIRPTASERTIDERITKLRHATDRRPIPEEDGTALIKLTRLSQIACMDRLLQRCAWAHRIQLLIEQAESSWSVPKVLGGALGLALAGYGFGCYELPGGWLPLLPAVVLGAAPFFILRFQKQRRLLEFSRHLPEAIDLMSRALRAGHSLTAAIEIVGEECPEPVRTEFREVYRQQNFGLPARDALLQLAQRMPLPELGFVVTAMLLQRETGGNLVEVLDRTTVVIRERLRIQGEIRIYTAQGRMTGWILSLLPIAMYFLLSLANRGYTRVLLEDPTGRKLVYGGLVLMIVGSLAIRKIVDVKV